MVRPATAQEIEIPAPVGGVNYVDSLAALPPYDAVQMINYIPREGYVELRKGFERHAYGISNDIVHLAHYPSLASGTLTEKLLAFDVDREAIGAAEKVLQAYAERLSIRQDSYVRMGEVVSEMDWPLVDGILLDLGASSIQFDQAASSKPW